MGTWRIVTRFVRARALARTIVSVPALASILGCGENQCPTQGQMRCQGTQLQWCAEYDSETIDGTYLAWEPFRPLPCSDYCVEADGQAFCSPTPNPIPECAHDGYGCWENAVVECQGGYPQEETAPCDAGTCTIDDSGCGYCLPPGIVAVPDPVCATPPYDTCPATDECNTTCVGNTVFQCNCGLRLAEATVCGDAGVCVSAAGSSACALSTVPDPQCTATNIPHGSDLPPEGQLGTTWQPYCEQGRLVECFGEFQWQVSPCEDCIFGSCARFGDAGGDGG